MARRRRDPTVERLADLPYNHEIVHCPAPQRAKQIRPDLRKGLLPPTKKRDKTLPCVGRRKFAGGKIAKLHGGNQNSGLANYQCYYRPPDRKKSI